MKKLIFAGVAGIMFGSLAVCAAEFSTYQEAEKAGKAAFKAKNYPVMRESFAQAKKLAKQDGTKWDALYQEVRACREMKQWDDAIKLLDEYLAGKVQDRYKGAAIFVKGLVYKSKGEMAKGTALLEDSLSYSGLMNYMKNQAAAEVLNYYYRQKMYDECISRAEKIIADGKAGKAVIESARFYIVQSKYDQKKFEECEKLLKEYTQLVESDPVKSRMAYVQALLHRDRKEVQEAIKYFELTIKYEPNSWRVPSAKKYIETHKGK